MKQRSTLEMLKYLSLMRPSLAQVANAGTFDPADWTEALKTAEARDFDQTLAAIAAHGDACATLLGGMSDADLRAEIDLFGNKPRAGPSSSASCSAGREGHGAPGRAEAPLRTARGQRILHPRKGSGRRQRLHRRADGRIVRAHLSV